MNKNRKFDYIFLVSAAIIIFFGLLILASVSAAFSQEKGGEATYYLFHQIYYGFIPGISIAFIIYKIPLGFIKKNAGLFFLGNLFLMVLIFFPFQPSEFLKLVFIIYLSAWLASPVRAFNKKPLAKKIKPDIDNNKRSAIMSSVLIPFLAILGVIAAFLIYQSDATTLGIIILSAFIMYFSANTFLLHPIIIFPIGV